MNDPDDLRWALLLMMTIVLTACGLWAPAEPEPTLTPLPTRETEPLSVRTFEAIWSSVNENYVYMDAFSADWQQLRDRYLAEFRVNPNMSSEEFAERIRTMLAELPEDAVSWQSREERVQQDAEASQRYEGIGAFVAFRPLPEPHIVLLSIIPQSPAEAAGLEAHDSILAIDGVPIGADEGIDAVNRIRGPAGSVVELLVRTPGTAPRVVRVTRGSLVAQGRMRIALIPGTEIGYIRFPPAPYDEMGQDALAGLQLLTDSISEEGEEGRLAGLILDLRISRSGPGWPIDILPVVFANGNLGDFFTRTEVQPFELQGQDFVGSQTVPLAILVGPDTHGAPEMFAAMMQSIGRASVVGLPTDGDVEQATEFRMPDGSRLVVATASYRTPDGRDVGLTGVEPTLRVEADWDQVREGSDPVLDAAVELLEGVRAEGRLFRDASSS